MIPLLYGKALKHTLTPDDLSYASELAPRVSPPRYEVMRR